MAGQNRLNAVSQRLRKGGFQTLQLIATTDAGPGRKMEFALDAELPVTSLKLSKSEKGAKKDATFLMNIDDHATVTDIVKGRA